MKSQIIGIILDVMNLIANFRLGLLLDTFKTKYRENLALVAELRKFDTLCHLEEEEQYEGELVKKLYDDFEVIFEHEDNKLLAVDKVSVYLSAVYEESVTFNLLYLFVCCTVEWWSRSGSHPD